MSYLFATASPRQGVSIDFMPHNSQDVLIIKDKMSGYVANMLCKKQTSKVDYVALPPLIYSCRIPYKDNSDGGGSFRNSFTNKLKKAGGEAHTHKSKSTSFCSN